MRKHALLAILFAASALAACTAQDQTVSAYTMDEPAAAPLDGTCRSVADTGDMYRYCMQYGPLQAMAH
jgi:hypothetical protein